MVVCIIIPFLPHCIFCTSATVPCTHIAKKRYDTGPRHVYQGDVVSAFLASGISIFARLRVPGTPPLSSPSQEVWPAIFEIIHPNSGDYVSVPGRRISRSCKKFDVSIDVLHGPRWYLSCCVCKPEGKEFVVVLQSSFYVPPRVRVSAYFTVTTRRMYVRAGPVSVSLLATRFYLHQPYLFVETDLGSF